jgi:HD-like signal output (HDOD) protein
VPQNLLSGTEMRNIIGSVGELSCLSCIYVCLSQAVRDPETPIAGIIEQDMAMTAKVLQLANSAFFGLARTVTSLSTAVSLLGMNIIKTLVLVTETFKAFVPDKCIPLTDHTSLQTNAQRTASVAVKLPVDPGIPRDIVVLAALLHDIGRLVLASKMPEKFCSTVALARVRSCEPFEAEEELLGTSHAEIGAYLLGLRGAPAPCN